MSLLWTGLDLAGLAFGWYCALLLPQFLLVRLGVERGWWRDDKFEMKPEERALWARVGRPEGWVEPRVAEGSLPFVGRRFSRVQGELFK